MQRKAKKLLSMPIVSLADGRQVGRVRGLVVDPVARAVVALLLDQRGWFQEPKVIPFARVRSIGDHAVTVESGTSVERVNSQSPLHPLLREPVPLAGARVITEDGLVLGTVEDFTFHTGSGQLANLELATSLLDSLWRGRAFLSASAVQTIGKQTIIVQPGADQLLLREEGGWQETADGLREGGKRVREAGARVWESTRETSRKLGQVVSRAVERFVPEEGQKKEAEDGPPPPQS